MNAEAVVAEGASLGGSIVPIIIVVVIAGAAIGGTYYAYDQGWILSSDDGNDITPLNNTNNNTNNNTPSGPRVTATFDFTWEDDDYNGQVSIKEAVQFDASGSSGGEYYYWDFGDGFNDITDSSVVTHYFTLEGNFNVTVNVSNDARWDEHTENVLVTAETNPAVILNAIVEPEPILGQTDTDITWRVGIQSASGSGSQMSVENIMIKINRTGSNESYYNSTVSDLTSSPTGQFTPWDAGIYYTDASGPGYVTSGDSFPIAGDGGISGFPVQSGDIFSIWFIPSGEMLDQVPIP